jgi:hypothetical protein
MTNKIVLVRGKNSGVHYGEMTSREGQEVTLTNARRVWYWEGANALDQLAMEGSALPKWFISPINKVDKDEYGHPTIKPLELVKRHIAHATQQNDIVADFFLGSGTTCVAAKELGRRYIGFEIDEQYYKIAKDRLNGINTNGQTSIFTDFDFVQKEMEI